MTLSAEAKNNISACCFVFLFSAAIKKFVVQRVRCEFNELLLIIRNSRQLMWEKIQVSAARIMNISATAIRRLTRPIWVFAATFALHSGTRSLLFEITGAYENCQTNLEISDSRTK
jgi:hypothetical protein